MAHPGFLEWATSIRIIMASDPGRQFFHDQVQNHGFLFLEGYLENILAGPKQDPIIDLVKTPARKRGRKAKRTISTKSKSKAVAHEDNDGKENIAPANTFYQTLLQAKMDLLAEADPGVSPNGDKTVRAKLDFSKKLEALQDIVVPRIEETLIDQVPYATPDAPLNNNRRPHSSSTLHAPSLGPSVVEQGELSVIVEADELAECSRNSIQVSHQESCPTQPEQTPLNLVLSGDHDIRPDGGNHDSVSSADSFHSANLSLPTIAHTVEVPSVSPSLTTVNPPADIAQSQVTPTLVENMTEPLPEIRPLNLAPAPSQEAVTEPLPSLPQSENVVPKEPMHKKSTTFMPILPAPVPARKSMRTVKEPPIAAFVNHSTPGIMLGGKRSSWLIKAREAKAMEDTTKKLGPLGLGPVTVHPTTVSTVSGVSGTLKRKSGDPSDYATGVLNDDGGRHKALKLFDGDTAPTTFEKQHAGAAHIDSHHLQTFVSPPPQSNVAQIDQAVSVHETDGILNRLKKTVEGLGARVGKSMGKSHGGPSAATLLAEARAAAEARVVKREIASGPVDIAESSPPAQEVGPSDEPAYAADHSRLSLSDLAWTQNKVSNQITRPLPSPPTFQPQPPPVAVNPKTHKISTSTTPPNSPPQNRPAISTHPIFRTSPVFVPPPKNAVPPARQEISATQLPTFSFVPPSGPVIAAPPIVRQSRLPTALSAQTTLESIASEPVFDADEDVPAWMPTTQDTEPSSIYNSQPGAMKDGRYSDKRHSLEEDDDSWPIDEKGPIWTFPAADDDDTWSDMDSVGAHAQADQATEGPPPPSTSEDFPEKHDSHSVRHYEDEYLGLEESEPEGIDVEPALSTVSLVDPKTISRSESQLSMTSSSSSNLGFLGQASKLVGSVLGASKKAKTEVRSLQRAAVAAKKQQEELDKKAVRLKEMENRRQRALQKKADDEKTRVLEMDKKLREEGERRKREREDNTDKKPLRVAVNKEDDTTKKRKVVVEIEKKPVKKMPATVPKAIPTKSFSKQLVAALNASSLNTVPAPTVQVAEAKTVKTPAGQTSLKGKGKAVAIQGDDIEPAQVIQSQMAARMKTQMQAAKHPDQEIASESIELPDINSEYSDSGDERPPGSFNPPHWAQSPELRQALEWQSTINPDEIFGAVRPLKMEEIFRARTSRFRARTSSANWSGPDGLTIQEEREYARRMGFKNLR